MFPEIAWLKIMKAYDLVESWTRFEQKKENANRRKETGDVGNFVFPIDDFLNEISIKS